MVDGEEVDRVTALIPYLAVMGFAPEVSGDTVVLRSCPLVTRTHRPRDLVCTMHEGLFQLPAVAALSANGLQALQHRDRKSVV